jgi:REP element-mobilizing transposase RayT
MREKSDSLFFAGGHHARLIDERVPFQVISRVFQGRHLLRPCDELNDIIIGVVARALELFPSVKLYALAFMSNHLHMMLQGASHEVPSFIGFVKREISRRWGGRDDVNWPGTMWHEYLATALPTPESEEECFEYVLAQGVKDNLVERPQDGPGVYTAKAIMGSGALVGTWFDATGYARARCRAQTCAATSCEAQAHFHAAAVVVHHVERPTRDAREGDCVITVDRSLALVEYSWTIFGVGRALIVKQQTHGSGEIRRH